jgi:hypothetical protein
MNSPYPIRFNFTNGNASSEEMHNQTVIGWDGRHIFCLDNSVKTESEDGFCSVD